MNALILVFHPMTIFELMHHGDTWRLRLNDWIINGILRCFEVHHFHLIRRNSYTNEFFFSVGNKSCNEVIADLNRLKTRLKRICFSMFVGETVNGKNISDANDLVLSFGLQVLNGALPETPSTHMFV